MKTTISQFCEQGTSDCEFIDYICETYINGQFTQLESIILNLLRNKEYDSFAGNLYVNEGNERAKMAIQIYIFDNLTNLIKLI